MSPPWDVKDVLPEDLVKRLRNWVQDPSSEPEIEQCYRSGQPLTVRRPERWEIEHRRYYPLYMKARELERMGKPDEALVIYRNILLDFTPIGTVYYERPAILLERKGEYQEAIAICDMAIANLKQEGAKEEFRRRKARLKKKLAKTQGR